MFVFLREVKIKMGLSKYPSQKLPVCVVDDYANTQIFDFVI